MRRQSGRSLVGNAIRNRQQQRGDYEGEMQQELPHDRVVRHWFGAYFDESFKQIDGRNADEGGRQFHFKHPGIDVGEPLGLVGVPFKIKTGNESFVAANDDHDQQIGDHDHIHQAKDRQHDGRFVDGRRLFHQVPQFLEKVVNVNTLGHDQADIEWGLEPSAQKNKTAQGRQERRTRFYFGLTVIHPLWKGWSASAFGHHDRAAGS